MKMEDVRCDEQATQPTATTCNPPDIIPADTNPQPPVAQAAAGETSSTEVTTPQSEPIMRQQSPINKIESKSSSNETANTAATNANLTTSTVKPSPPKRPRKKKADTPTTPVEELNPKTAATNATPTVGAIKPTPKRSRKKKTDGPTLTEELNTKTAHHQPVSTASGTAMAPAPLMINTSMSNNKISRHSNSTEAQETSSRNHSPNKRKSRSSSKESTNAPNAAPSAVPTTPAKRPRKKKTDPPAQTSTGASSSVKFSNTQPISVNTPLANDTFRSLQNTADSQEMSNRYYSPTMISSYANLDTPNAASMINRSSLSRLFTSSSVNGGSINNNQINSADDPVKAFEELREKTWSHLSAWVLEQAQQFDVPSLISTLYKLRAENEKLLNKVKDLTMKRDQLIAMNARLDMPGPKLTQHLNSTSPNFSSVVSGLTNSPISLPTSSPGSAIVKTPMTPIGTYNHIPPPGSLSTPGFLDRSSPYSCQPHSGIPNLKSSSISTPSPPIGALMAHRPPSLITVNPSMPNVYPHTLAPLGPNQHGSSNYQRQ